jgi:hypothetical protein
MDHIKILKRALHITWKYRALWLVGLLLVLAGGGVMGGSGASSGGGSGGSGGGDASGRGFDRGWTDFPSFWRDAGPIIVAIAVVVLLVLALSVLIGIVAAVVRYVTRVSLIRMVDEYEETGEELGFRSGFGRGWSGSALHLFLISLVLKLPIALLMVALILPMVGLAVMGFVNGASAMIALGVVLILLVIPVVLLGVALGTVVGPVVQVSYRTCALEGLGAWEAIRSAFGLIRRNLGATALQWLLLVGLGIAWQIALLPVNLLLVALGFMIGGLPALAVGGLAGLGLGWPWGIGLGMLVFLPVFILIVALPNVALNTLATVFHSTTWTLTYRELIVIDSGSPDAVETDEGEDV